MMKKGYLFTTQKVDTIVDEGNKLIAIGEKKNLTQSKRFLKSGNGGFKQVSIAGFQYSILL